LQNIVHLHWRLLDSALVVDHIKLLVRLENYVHCYSRNMISPCPQYISKCRFVLITQSICAKDTPFYTSGLSNPDKLSVLRDVEERWETILFVIYGYVIYHIYVLVSTWIELQLAIAFVFSVFYLCNINIASQWDYTEFFTVIFVEAYNMIIVQECFKILIWSSFWASRWLLFEVFFSSGP
jgi:hypothetical protein